MDQDWTERCIKQRLVYSENKVFEKYIRILSSHDNRADNNK